MTTQTQTVAPRTATRRVDAIVHRNNGADLDLGYGEGNLA